jgi:hypothetical protein
MINCLIENYHYGFYRFNSSRNNWIPAIHAGIHLVPYKLIASKGELLFMNAEFLQGNE